MRTKAGVAKLTERRRLARSASLRSQLFGWLFGLAVFGWLLGFVFGWLVSWFPAFSLDCFTLENYRLSRNVSIFLRCAKSQKSADIIGIAAEDCNHAKVAMFKFNIK